MKTPIFIFVFFISATIAFSQTCLNNKLNVFYVGVENELFLSITAKDCKDFTVSSDNGIVSGSPCSLLFKPEKAGMVNFTVNTKDKIYQIRGRAKLVKDPILLLEKQFGYSIPIDALKNTKKLIVTLQDFDYEIFFSIKSFDVSLLRKNQLLETIHLNGIVLDSTFTNLLEKCEAGDVVLFSNILMQAPEGERKMEDKIFMLKN